MKNIKFRWFQWFKFGWYNLDGCFCVLHLGFLSVYFDYY
jgi:hypothetical protein